MEIKYDIQLMESVVREEIYCRERAGDLRLCDKYHEIADPIYELPPEKQEERFQRLYTRFFLSLGKDNIIREVLEEFTWLNGKIKEIVIKRADSEDGSFLRENKDSIAIKILPERFLEISGLKRFMRHELMHIYDMLDEEFAYRIQKGSSPREGFKILRYGIIWDIYIDSRLIKAGKDTLMNKDSHYQEFEEAYPGIPPSLRSSIFENLWSMEKMTHKEIIEMAEDPKKLLKKVQADGNPVGIFLPGSPCPVCGFPTYNWEENLNRGIIKRIKEDYPEWEPEHGVCKRCIEVYEVMYSE